MNGDLSLSQSLGGLRIANPDDRGSSPPAPPPATSFTALSLDQIASQSYGGGSRSPGSVTPVGSPQNATDPHGGLDSAGAFESQSYSSVHAPIGAQQYGLQHKTSESMDQDVRQRVLSVPHSRFNGPTRPASGLYNPPNMANTPESAYSRMRSDTGQSNTAVRRSGSRSGFGFGVTGAPLAAANGSPYRSHSNSNASSDLLYPPRRSSKTKQYADDRYGPHATSLPAQAETTLGRAEEYRDRSSRPDASKSKPVKKGVKDFSFGRTLGEGSYSTVMAAKDRTSSKEYAIKILDKRHIIKEKKVKYVNIEKDTLNRLTEHPGVVRLYYTFQDERSLYFVLDLAASGELLGVLKKMTTFDEDCTRFYSAQILDTVEYMHSRGIIHRDLKPENVLLDDQMYVKITDFGTAKILDLPGKPQFGKVSINEPLDGADQDRAVSFVGTAEYVSPELLTEKNACKASDLWAFGCIVYQLLAGRPPFKAANEYLTFQKIVKLDYAFPEGFPSVAKDLVTRLLVLDPAERLPIDEIKRHPFFAGIQWGTPLWKSKPPKLRSYNPASGQDAKAREFKREPAYGVPTSSSMAKPHASTGNLSNSARPSQRVITELAPPSQLDLDWSPVLTKTNERIVKLGQLVVYMTPSPHSPVSRSVSDMPEQQSKLSRFFSGNVTKKRQRLVMVTSSGRLVLAPAGGDRKEAKLVVDLTDTDVFWRSQQDNKGYTVWCVYTREKYLTFEDSKVNVGDAGLSTRSAQEWLDIIEQVKDYVPSQTRSADPFAADANLAQAPARPLRQEIDEPASSSEALNLPAHRNFLRKEHASEDDSLKGRKRFSRRHSKNGLAAVF